MSGLLRRGAPTFGQHVSALRSAANGHQLFIPAGFAHGLCTLEPHTLVSYKVSNYYAPAHERGLAWADPDLGIAWPVAAERAIVSARDRQHPRLVQATDLFA
jgi:dTDP-4-dehydrorhamnose 3,5-epimerase